LKDKFGLSWQVVPRVATEMLQEKDSEKSQRVMKAIMGNGQDRHRSAKVRLRGLLTANEHE